MAYVIQTRYKADAGELHAQSRAAHLEYLSNNLDRLLAAGGLIDDDGTGGQGGVIILDTEVATLIHIHDPNRFPTGYRDACKGIDDYLYHLGILCLFCTIQIR